MAMAPRAPAPSTATTSQTRMERTRFMVAQAPSCRPSRGEKGDVRHRMRDFEQRQLPKGFCRANPLELCEFADKMLRTKKHCQGEPHAACFVASGGFLLFCFPTFRFCFSASGTEKRRVVASQNARTIAKSHERRGGEEPRNRSGCGAGFEWATAMVRRYRQGGPGRKQGYCLRHRISRRLHQQNLCGPGTA